MLTVKTSMLFTRYNAFMQGPNCGEMGNYN